MLGPLLEVEMSKKCTLLWREAHFQVKRAKKMRGDDFWTFRCRFAWQARGIGHLVKSDQNVRVLLQVQKRWQAWDMQRIWQDALRVAGAVQETCSSELLGGPGADFLRGVAFWSIRSSVWGR